MRLTALSCLACLALAPARAASTSETPLPPDVLLLARVKRHVNASLARLPDFACLENVTRLVRESPKKPIRDLDALRFEIAVVHGRELFSWPDQQSSFSDVVPLPGLSSTGQFFSLAKALFGRSSAAVITYRGQEPFNGAPAARYDFSISSLFFRENLNVDGHTATVGAQGSFWVDPATANLLRIEDRPSRIPDELTTSSIATLVDYAPLLLDGKPFLFPQTAIVTLVRSSGAESQNHIEFTQCRQYSVASTISPSASPASAQSAPSAPPAQEFQIPPGVAFHAALASPIFIPRAHPGDVIRGRLTAAALHGHTLVAPQGATLTGRIRLLFLNHDLNANFLTLGCEFTDLTYTDPSGQRHHALFYAFLKGFSTLPGVSDSTTSATAQRMIDRTGNWADLILTRTYTPPELPGVATLFIDPSLVTLPEGFGLTFVSGRFPHAP